MIYSYAELKGKIKVGDKVRAVAGKYNRCGELIDIGSDTKVITKVDNDFFWINDCSHGYYASSFLEIVEEPAEEQTEQPQERVVTWENLQKGDVIFDKDNNERTILARIEDIVSVSNPNEKTYHYTWFSIEQLKQNGYKPEPLKPKRKVTLAEIAEKFGEEVEVVE